MKLKRIASAVMAAVMAVTSAVVCEVTANAANDVTLFQTTVDGAKSVKLVYDISSDDAVDWDAIDIIINTWDNGVKNGDYIKYGIGGSSQAQYYGGNFVNYSSDSTDQELVVDLTYNPDANFQVITNANNGKYDLFISHVYVYGGASASGTVLYTWDNPALDTTTYDNYALSVPDEGTIFAGTFDSTKISGPNSGIEVKLNITGAWGGLTFRPLAADGENLDSNIALATYQNSTADTGELTKFIKFSDFTSVPEKFGFDIWSATITSITIVNDSTVGTIYTENQTVAVTSVTLDETSLTLKEGETATLTATVLPDNATDNTVTWTSSDTDVATVADGVVTAIAEGAATITAKAGEKSATCSVTVTPVPVKTVTIAKPNQTTYKVGETVALTASVNSDATVADKEIVWSSSDDAIATVNKTTGTVEFKAEGTVTITAAYKSDATIKDTVTLSATNDEIPVSTVTITAPGKTVYTVGDSITLVANVNSDATVADKEIVWSSSDDSIATIDASTGVVTFVSYGTATFTASYKSDTSISDSVSVGVVAADYVESEIEFNKTATTPTNINAGCSDYEVYVMAISKEEAESNSSVKVTVTADGTTHTGYITTVYKQFKYTRDDGGKFIETGADGTYFVIVKVAGTHSVNSLSVSMELIK